MLMASAYAKASADKAGYTESSKALAEEKGTGCRVNVSG